MFIDVYMNKKKPNIIRDQYLYVTSNESLSFPPPCCMIVSYNEHFPNAVVIFIRLAPFIAGL
ncbi:hypothetical protein DERP_011833 [Dermatophagoides pteronyssinus]|uniref:Uncharacterized protein n=1 Tax=Dermatophagoides pteronyssinus TaxID=6956 RepID=A0ABQ8JR64_DERPT|nr:hypothetical protein DERP_011833 [Dermatophagoides pteronyssinus]